MKIEVYPRRTLFGRRWFFRIKAGNGETIAQSESYHNRGDAMDTARLLRGGVFDAVIAQVER